MNKNVIKKMSIVVLAVITILFAYAFVHAIRASFVDYSVFSGISGSEPVGFENYQRFFEYKFSRIIIRNTILINIFAIIFGAIYTFLATSAISSFEKPMQKRVFAFLFLIPALIPTQLYTGLINTVFDYKVSETFFQPIVAFITGIRLAAFVSLFSIFMKGSTIKTARKCTLVFIAIKLVTFFTVDISISVPLYDPIIINVSETISAYMYKCVFALGSGIGLSYGIALDVLRAVFQIIPAVVAVFTLRYLAREKEEINENINFKFAGIAGIIPAVILIVFLAAFSTGKWFVEGVPGYYMNSLWQSLFSAILVSLLAVITAYAISNLKTTGIAIVCAILCVSDMTVTRYLLGYQKMMPESSLGVIIANLSILPMVSLILAFVIEKKSSIKSYLQIIIVAFGALFSWFWNDFAIFGTTRSIKYPMSSFVNLFFNKAETTQMIEFSFLLYMLVPLVVSGLCIFASGLIKDKNADE